MSDDYDDPDEPGGLWDPDAIAAPPPPRRPALHAVPPPDLIEDEASSVDRIESWQESLVRLDQFRRVPDDEADFDERARRRWRRGRPLVAAAVIAGAILATGLPGLTSEGRRAPKPAAARFFGGDAEQAALTRTVQSAATGADHAPGDQRRAAHASTRARDSARASHRRQSAQTPRRGEALASGAATSSKPLTVAASQSPPSPTRSATRSSAAPASATSAEFSFER
jgi:hypothetical protein